MKAVSPPPHKLGNWKKIKVDSASRCSTARSGAQAVVNNRRIYFFGGYTRKGGEYFNDLFWFDTQTSTWHFANSENAPAQRTDHSIVEFDGGLYIYGGRDEVKIFSDLHRYSLKDDTWECISSFVSEPKLRFGHTAVKIGNEMIVFGGWDGVTTLSDLFAFNFETKKWREIEADGEIKGRYRHVSVASKTAMYVFGGIDQYTERFNDLYEFQDNKWTKVITIGVPPSPRTFHQAVYFSGSIYIMGGFDGWKRNDMYKILIDRSRESQMEEEVKREELKSEDENVFSSEYFEQLPLLEWGVLDPQGMNYSPRTGHEAIYHNDKVYLFGGTDDDQRKNDLYCYDIYKNKWSLLPSQGSVPTRRSGTRGIAYKNHLFFFGGYFKKSDQYYSDLYAYNLDTQRWSIMPDAGQTPPARIDHTANLYNGKLYIFGGFDGNLRYADFYMYDLKKQTWMKLVGEGELPPNRFGHTTVIYEDSLYCFGGWNGHYTMDDIYQYSFKTNIWYEIKRVKGEKPLSRYRHSAILCNSKMYIFGGVDTNQR